MRLAFTAFGSAGDVLPVLSIAEAAAARGHEVVALVNPSDVALAEARGVRAVAYGAAWSSAALRDRPEWLHRSRGSLAMLRDLMAPRARELVPALRELLSSFGPDAVVHHQASFGVGWVCDPEGIRRVMVSVAPAGWPSVDDPSRYPPMPDRDSYPRWTVRVGSVFGRRGVNRAVDPVLNEVRRELGMAPGRSFMFEEQFGGALNIGMWSPAFRGPADDDPPNAVIAGFPRAATAAVAGGSGGGATSEVEDFLRDGGHGAVAITLGTTAVHAGVDSVGLACGLARGTGRRVVVLGAGDGGVHAEGRVLAAGFVPHGLVLGRCAAVVHHGGIGTTGAALRAGVPSVVVPFTHDQPDNARRVRMLGCGVVLQPGRLSDGRLRAAIARVCGEAVRRRCGEMVDATEHEDGGVRGCEAIEAVLGGSSFGTVREGFEPSRP